MNLFKNKVGRPSNKQKLNRKILTAAICLIFLASIFTILNVSNNKLKGSLAEEYFYVKGDSILRSAPKTTPNSSIAIIKGTKVIHKNNNKDTKNYYYVTVSPNTKGNEGFYLSEFSGYILKRRLTKYKTSHDSDRNLKVSQKTYLVRNSLLLYKYNNKNGSKVKFGYSYKSGERNTGYNLIVNNKKRKSGIYYFDCSALISTIMKVTYDIDFKNSNGTLYNTYKYYNEVKNKNIGDITDHFVIVDKVNKNSSRKSLETDKLQIGDIILGINKYRIKDSGKLNHIMLYVGDNKIIQSSGRLKEKIRYNNLTSEYVTLGKRYSKQIYILRLKDGVAKGKNKLKINKNKDGFDIVKLK